MTSRHITYILVILSTLTFGQNSCNDKDLADREKKFLKADKKGKADTYEFADLAFNIAECYRQKTDSNSLKWYRLNAASGKASIKGCDRYHNSEVNRTIGQIGISEFYLGHIKESIRYLHIAIGHSKNPEHYYFLGLCEMNLGNYEIAFIEFNNFKKTSSDHKDVEDLIKKCESNIKSK